jgi:hypothetical protein
MSDDPRLDAVEEKIQKARQDAEDAGILEDPDEPHYYESGADGGDDQTITPPG